MSIPESLPVTWPREPSMPVSICMHSTKLKRPRFFSSHAAMSIDCLRKIHTWLLLLLLPAFSSAIPGFLGSGLLRREVRPWHCICTIAPSTATCFEEAARKCALKRGNDVIFTLTGRCLSSFCVARHLFGALAQHSASDTSTSIERPTIGSGRELALGPLHMSGLTAKGWKSLW